MEKIKDFFKDLKNYIVDFFEGLREIQIFNSDFTLREFILSIGIGAVAIVLGLWISSEITNAINEKNIKYEQTIQIQTADEFAHCLNTNIPSVFSYGEMKSDDSVGFDYIGYNYMYARREHEHYTKHKRWVDDYKTITRSDGTTKRVKDGGHWETYYTWDYVDGETRHVDKVLFNDVAFDYDELDLPCCDYYNTDYYGCDDRNVYRAITKDGHVGTLYAEIDNKKLKYNSFHESRSTEETYESYLTNSTVACVFFWIIWLGLCGFGIFYFIVMENDWLNKN